MKNLKKLSIFIFAAAAMVYMWSCEEGDDNVVRLNHDPSKPIEITGFTPDSGGLATRVVISGSNFGSDVSKIRVWFNETRAPVISSNGNAIFVVTPRQPGDENFISVVVGNDSAVFTDKMFLYQTMISVTTVAGRRGTGEFREGGTLSTVEFMNPSSLCIDAEGNIFLSHWHQARTQFHFVVINEERDYVRLLFQGGDGFALGAPTADRNGRVVVVPTDRFAGYISFDPEAQWAAKRTEILQPTLDMRDEGIEGFGMPSGNWHKHGMAACVLTGFIYTRIHQRGQLVKFDPITRYGQLVRMDEWNSDSFPYFDPNQPNILYLVLTQRHTIYYYDTLTEEFGIYAGNETPGHRDGDRLDAQFRNPRQITVDSDGNMYVADVDNHCIRMITPDGQVLTVLGKAGVRGYQDGNREDALFDGPRGVAVDKDNNIYVADFANNVIRKLAVQ